MNRTVGIIATVITALCCGCFALFSCIFGGIIAAGGPVTTNGVDVTYPPAAGIGLMCVSVIFILIPVAIGIFTFRMKPAAAAAVPQNFDGPIPPAS